MHDKQKIIVDVPQELNEKIDKTKIELMITKSAVVKLAVNKFCNEVLKK